MDMRLDGCTIVFDLDGTLADTAPDLHRTLNVIMDEEGLPEVELEAVRNFVGQGARATIARAADAAGRQYSPHKLDKLLHRFIDVYSNDIARLSRLFPGVENALDQLEGMGAQFCVCTNKKTDLAVQLLEELQVSRRFRAIVGADAVENRKPHKQHYEHALSLAGGTVSKSLMVGDSAADAGAARSAGAPVVLTTFGYTETPVETLGADALISHFDELPHLAATLLLRARNASPR